MEWDQIIFKKISDVVQWFRRERIAPEVLANAVHLEQIQPRLTALARLLTGIAVRIQPAEQVGGWRGIDFFLPERYDHAATSEQNLDFYLFRVFYLYGQFQLRQCWTTELPQRGQDPEAQAEATADAVLDYLRGQFPAFDDLYQKVREAELHYQQKKYPKRPPRLHFIYGHWHNATEQNEAELKELLDPLKKNTVAFDKNKEEYTEIKSPNKEHTEVLKVNTQEQENYTLTHNFEKIETLDAFSGRWRDFDGSDELEEHAEALNELDLRYLVRVDNPVHSVYKTEFVQSLGLVEANTFDSPEYHLNYPEWDEARGGYKSDFCKVFPSFLKNNKPDFTQQTLLHYRSTVQQMQRHAERFLTDYFMKKRLAWGDEPDLDAMVEAFSDRRSGVMPSENLYASKRKRSRDIAVLVLCDASLSTDGYTQNKRVLDTEKEALLLVGEVWSRLGLRFQMDAFSSRTHNHCNYQTIKGFHEDWQETRDRVGALESSGYTRIGAALRHATYLLEQVRADTKWLLLLTDGKPNDFDKYEGKYGIADTRKAIVEAQQQRIRLSAIAIDEKAKFYLPQMFGKGGFEILSHAKSLPFALLNNYLKMNA